jgi:fructuronate reductase
MVHLGLGNFHRAHQAVHTARALEHAPGPWGVVGIATSSSTVVDALRRQDLLHTVVEVSPEGARTSIPAVHSDVFVAASDPRRVVAEIAAERTRIVSLTVTEHGYGYSAATGRLDRENPAIAADLNGDLSSPRSTIGRLAAGLALRARSHGEPVTVLSCDNLSGNGEHTARLLHEFADDRGDAELTRFLERTGFPNSMVDRIVPATTDAHRELVERELGRRDEVPVPAEPFSMWVVEDAFPAGRPAWELGGVVFSDEVERYEELKLRLLNGTHSLLAYLGALQGHTTIAAAVTDDDVERAARGVLAEYLPSVRVPSGVDAAEYVETLFVRWRNHALGHRTGQVGSDGSVKLRQRVPGPALRLLDSGPFPDHLALTVAGYLTCVAPPTGFDPGPAAAEMRDPAAAALRAESCADGTALARFALEATQLLGAELGARREFTARVGELVDVLHRDGVAAAVRDVG